MGAQDNDLLKGVKRPEVGFWDKYDALQKANPAPNKDNIINYYNDLTEQLKPSVTPEEEAKRIRKAYAGSAVGALGNAMSALANVFFVSKGAVSQKIPEAYNPTKDVDKFQDKLQKARERYLESKATARLRGMQEYGTLMNQRNAEIAQQYGVYKDQQNAQEREAAWKYGVNKDAEAIKHRNDVFEESKRHNEASEKLSRERLYRTSGSVDDDYDIETITEQTDDNNGTIMKKEVKRKIPRNNQKKKPLY